MAPFKIDIINVDYTCVWNEQILKFEVCARIVFPVLFKGIVSLSEVCFMLLSVVSWVFTIFDWKSLWFRILVLYHSPFDLRDMSVEIVNSLICWKDFASHIFFIVWQFSVIRVSCYSADSNFPCVISHLYFTALFPAGGLPIGLPLMFPDMVCFWQSGVILLHNTFRLWCMLPTCSFYRGFPWASVGSNGFVWLEQLCVAVRKCFRCKLDTMENYGNIICKFCAFFLLWFHEHLELSKSLAYWSFFTSWRMHPHAKLHHGSFFEFAKLYC